MAGGYLTKNGFVLDETTISKPKPLSPDSVCGAALADKTEEPQQTVQNEPTNVEVTTNG